MHSNELKKMLGLAIQVDRLASDQSVLKLFTSIDFESSRDVYDVIEQVNNSKLMKKNISYAELIDSQKYIDEHLNLGINIVPFGDDMYPLSLAMTPNPPAMIYVKGDINILKALPGVAIVGSRDVSPAGEEITKRITSRVCKENFVIVSGLAIGTDTNAHKATLKAKGKTIAVLAHGLEAAKPRQNARLADEILHLGGAWISEYPIGRPAWKQSFVQRNRIQVGLSAVSILIEAAKGSGTMTQADFALKAARPIFAVVPHKEYNPLYLNCEGTEYLVQQNLARALKTSEDYDILVSVILQSSAKIKSYAKTYAENMKQSLF